MIELFFAETDLTVTNISRLKKALELGACGSFVFKPNQVGTVTEAMKAQEFAIKNGMFSVPSIRAGGVNDDPVADMGIAGGAAAIKQGPPKNGQGDSYNKHSDKSRGRNSRSKAF